MTPLQLELTRLIGKNELSFGCIFISGFGTEKTIAFTRIGEVYWVKNGMLEGMRNEPFKECMEIIGHPATLSDFHRWMNENGFDWLQSNYGITYTKSVFNTSIPYDSSKELLDQSEETLRQIINLITNNS